MVFLRIAVDFLAGDRMGQVLEEVGLAGDLVEAEEGALVEFVEDSFGVPLAEVVLVLQDLLEVFQLVELERLEVVSQDQLELGGRKGVRVFRLLLGGHLGLGPALFAEIHLNTGPVLVGDAGLLPF